jgi:hypothetical protein
MPLNKILFYPDFEPSKLWFRSHLLFYDTIHSVIPQELRYKPTSEISDIIKRLPHSFEPIKPLDSDKKFDKFNEKLFDSAFNKIKKNSKKYPNEFQIKIHPDKWKITGNAVFFHNKKMSEEMYDLLEKHHLIHIGSQEFNSISGIDLKDFSVVNRYASDIILSHIADNMAKRLHVNSITNNPFAFSVNSLNPIPIQKDSQKKGLLTSAIIRCIIPEKVEELSTDQFLEIRDEYSDVRESIHEISKKLAEFNDLGEINDNRLLENEINDISNEFSKQVNTLENSVSPDIVKKFVPIFFGATGIICGDYFNEPMRTGGRMASIVLSQIISDRIAIPETEKAKFQRRISSLQHEINWQSDLRRLLKSGWY